MNILARYQDVLRNMPSPGSGCHTAILGISNWGVMAGIPPDEIFQDIRQAVPSGTRRIPDKEIHDAIPRHFLTTTEAPSSRAPDRRRLSKTGKLPSSESSTRGRSATRSIYGRRHLFAFMDEPQGDPALLLETLYETTDLVWIGDRHQPGIIGDTIKTTGELIGHFKNGGKTGPFIIINPLTGTSAPKKAGDGETLRGDGNVATYRYCMAEFDNLSRENQIRFWSAVKLPIVALIDSGGKSIHAWLQVSKIATVTTLEQWQSEIKHRLYNRLLTPLGVDRSCSNPARLSRQPGHYREEKDAWQRLLWLSAEGRPICQLTT